MKKTLVALAALSAAAGAMAQSTVTIYGALDVGVAYAKNVNNAGKSNTYLNDSAIQSSLWGIKGSEDLGNGLRANFNLQGDVAMDTGSGPATGEIFRREASVSLASASMGEIKLGRTISPAYVASLGNQIIPQNSIGVSTAVALGYGADIFTKNAVTYYSPDMAGLKATAQYSFGEVEGESKAGRKIAGSLIYGAGDLKAALGGEQVTGTDGELSRRWYNVSAQYSLGDFRLAGGLYWFKKGDTTTSAGDTGNAAADSSHGWSLGAGYQFNQQALVAVTYVDNSLESSLLNVTARYALSKRTALYALAARSDNGTKNVNFTPLWSSVVGGPYNPLTAKGGTVDKKQGALQIGVIHAF